MITKKWSELTKSEKTDAFLYIKLANDNAFNQSDEYRLTKFEGTTFDYGNLFFVFYLKGEIVGTAGIVAKEICNKGIAYIVELRSNIDYEIQEEILTYAKDICLKKDAKQIKIGIHEVHDYFIPWMNQLGFNYLNRLMTLEKTVKEIYSDTVELKLLQRNEACEFAKIMTSAFIDSPNGASVSEDDALEQIEKDELIGLMYKNQVAVAAFELGIVDEIGWIDSLAVPLELQNKGYGKLLLRSTQNYLWNKGVESIKMCVFDTHKIAYQLYLNHEFKEVKTLSKWYLYMDELA